MGYYNEKHIDLFRILGKINPGCWQARFSTYIGEYVHAFSWGFSVDPQSTGPQEGVRGVREERRDGKLQRVTFVCIHITRPHI